MATVVTDNQGFYSKSPAPRSYPLPRPHSFTNHFYYLDFFLLLKITSNKIVLPRPHSSTNHYY